MDCVGAPDFDDMMAAARSGDEAAWARLYAEFSPVLLGYLRVRGAAEPEDVLGDVFLDVARGLDRFEGGDNDFRAWTFTIARRRVIDERRRRGRRPVELVAEIDESHSDEGADDPASTAISRISQDEVIALFSSLSDDQRDVLLLRIIGVLTVNEIAEIIDKRPGAVKALQRRGLATLRKKFGPAVPL